MKLAVVFGSRSVEHDVSIVSGLQLLENVDKRKHEAYPVYIARNGEWFVGEPLRSIAFYRDFQPDAKGLTRVYLKPAPGHNGLYAQGAGGFLKKADAKVADMDCAILALHGMHGEDGAIQGLFEMADIPYTSVGVTGSGVGMDKIIMKAVFQSMGLPVLPARHCTRGELKESPERVLDHMEQLGYPLIVKPANLGSSIGIGVARNRAALLEKMEVAALYDRRVLVEKCLEKRTEINCAAVGYATECTVSLCEQPIGSDELLSFGDKYLSGNTKSANGMASLSRIIPAPIDEALTAKIQGMTRDVFKMLECKGVVRIDYMIDQEDGSIYINEINTIPGSFAYYLFEPMGIAYPQLIDMLVESAVAALEEKKGSVFAFDSSLLTSVVLGGAKGAKSGAKG